MKAAYLETTGAPDVIEYGELPTPKPAEGEVLIRTAVAALNPIDVYVRAGTVKMQLPMPFITGSDVAGTVTAVGPGVTRLAVGQRVWGTSLGLLGRQGTCAEFVCAAEHFFYPTPAGVDDAQAAGAGLVGITAHLGLVQRAHVQPGETVFVNGGTGGVGSMVLQMTKASGARVITTVGSSEKAELCRKWGADRVLNYKSDDVPAGIKDATGGKGVDIWFETQREPNFLQTVELMAARARIIIIAGRQAQPTFPVGPFYVKGLSLFGYAMFNATPEEQRRAADDINRWLADKKLHVPIGRTFPLAQTAEAHRFLEDATLKQTGALVGKVVVQV